MRSLCKIALVGDYDPEKVAHQCIPKALALSASALGIEVEPVWLETSRLTSALITELNEFHGVWCVPGSPYKNGQGVLEVIRFARETGKPYLGTCGGCQHAILEFARNVLQLEKAGLEEEDPGSEMPLISSLPCRLLDENRKIFLKEGSRLNNLIGKIEIDEEYRCGFGVNPKYLHLFAESDLQFVGFNEDHVPQAFELRTHPFFVGTAFQPERSARQNLAHPLINAFLRAMVRTSGRFDYRFSSECIVVPSICVDNGRPILSDTYPFGYCNFDLDMGVDFECDD